MKKQNQAFTLVELIVVITILAILWTIAFISLQWYSAQARDSKRLSDIQNIKKSLELFSLNTWKYPLPDDGEEVLYGGDTLWTQWTVWNTVSTNLSRNLNEKPLDPLTELEYTYSAINSQTKYELLSIYESDLISFSSPSWRGIEGELLNQTNAASADYPKVDWNYNWLFVKTEHYYFPTPSLVTSELIPLWWITLDENNIQSQIVTWWNNIPSVWTTSSSTWELDINLSVYTWSLDSESTALERQELITQLQWAYLWTTLANQDIYKELLSVTNVDEEIKSYVDVVVLNIWTYSSSSNTISDTTPPEWWSFIITSNWTDEITETNSTSVILNITCPTDVAWSTPIQVAYWNTTEPINWVTCTASISHTLTAWDWEKTVYMKFKDSLGNETNEVNNNIELISIIGYDASQSSANSSVQLNTFINNVPNWHWVLIVDNTDNSKKTRFKKHTDLGEGRSYVYNYTSNALENYINEIWVIMLQPQSVNYHKVSSSNSYYLGWWSWTCWAGMIISNAKLCHNSIVLDTSFNFTIYDWWVY